MLEIACFEMTSAETALQSVANRIEFCADLQSGGITPSIEEFQYLREKYEKPIYVMIRPTGGPFFFRLGSEEVFFTEAFVKCKC